jgi:hypothetical protein
MTVALAAIRESPAYAPPYRDAIRSSVELGRVDEVREFGAKLLQISPEFAIYADSSRSWRGLQREGNDPGTSPRGHSRITTRRLTVIMAADISGNSRRYRRCP